MSNNPSNHSNHTQLILLPLHFVFKKPSSLPLILTQHRNIERESKSEANCEMGSQEMRSDSFVVDLESLSNGVDNDFASSSRITRSLSRKATPTISRGGGGGKKIIISSQAFDRDTPPLVSTSPSQGTPAGENNMSEKPASPPRMAAADSTIEQQTNQVPQHQITIRAANISAIADGKLTKRQSLRRPTRSWFSDPRRILLFFATLSSIGSIMLIVFLLNMSKPNDNDVFLD
ncbi:hypothetical protein AKJ16_DCAP00404 [Drosera capensis]